MDNEKPIATHSLADAVAAANRWRRPTDPQNYAPMGPGVPVMPVDPEEDPRQFQYPVGVNLQMIPRSGYNLTPYPVLRSLAAACQEVRLNIEQIKREVRALRWEIVPDDTTDAADYTAEIKRATRFLSQPDGAHDFDSWVSSLLEDVLVIDAATIYPQFDHLGRLAALEQIDGATIRPVLDFRGRVAQAPLPGYIQVLWGTPRSWYTTDRLLYRPINQAVNSPYGASPLEWIVLSVNLAIRRQAFHVAYFSTGNVPEALVGAPQSWTKTEIDEFQLYWDALVSGKISQFRKLHFVPTEGSGSLPVYEFKRDNMDNTARDTWLMQVACWAYGNSPAEFGIIPGGGLGGSGFTASMENIQYRSMLGPITQWLSGIFDYCLQDLLGLPGLRFSWVGLMPQDDKMQQAQIDALYLQNGVYTRAHIQDRLGIPPEHRPDIGDATPAPGLGMPGIVPQVSPVSVQRSVTGAARPQFFRSARFEKIEY